MTSPTLKIILIGNSGVGKSSLSCHFTEHHFTDQDTTIGVEFGSENITIDKESYKIQVWDTAGQETFRAITKSYYRMAMGVLLVYDVTNPSSFQAIPGWYRSIQENCSDNIPIILVGNKSDQDNTHRKVTYQEGQTFADQHSILFCETSAKSLESTRNAFVLLAEKIVRENDYLNKKTDSDVTQESLIRLRGLIDRKNKKIQGPGRCC